MPKDTRRKKANGGKGNSQWRGLPVKLRGIPGSEQLFSMWGNDSFRQPPPIVPAHALVWDVHDPSRTLPYSIKATAPIAPPGVAFVTETGAARSKQNLRRLLPTIRPSDSHSHSNSLAPSSSIAPALPQKSYLYTYQADIPSGHSPGPVLSWPPPPPPPGYVKDEPMVDELPSEGYTSGSERDLSSPERSSFSVFKVESPTPYLPPYLPIPPLPCSPPLSPWSSPGRTCLSPLLPGEGLPARVQSPPAVARAQSEPLPRGDEALSVYEACRLRRLPPMVFKKNRLAPLPELAIDLVLPALRVPSSAPDQQDSADEGRDFDASCQQERRARYSPYTTGNASRRAHTESEGDLPPLRLLLAELEIDEHRRAQSVARYGSSSDQALRADKLLSTLAPATKKRRSPTSSRRRRGATTAEVAAPVPTPSSSATRLGLRHPGQVKTGAVARSGVAIPCNSGGRASPAVHPQRGGLHAL